MRPSKIMIQSFQLSEEMIKAVLRIAGLISGVIGVVDIYIVSVLNILYLLAQCWL